MPIVRYPDFERIVKIASAVRRLQTVGDSTFTNAVLRPILRENFLEVFKSEGGSIGMPFPRPKEGGKPWAKFRLYDLPGELKRWQLGIWTGGTAYSVLNFGKSHNANTSLHTGKGLVRMTIRHNIYANVTFGLSAKTVEKIQEAVFMRIEKALKKEAESAY